MIPIFRGELHFPSALDATCAKQVMIQVDQVQAQAYCDKQPIPEIDHDALGDESPGDERPAHDSQVEQEHRNGIHLQKGGTLLRLTHSALWRWGGCPVKRSGMTFFLPRRLRPELRRPIFVLSDHDSPPCHLLDHQVTTPYIRVPHSMRDYMPSGAGPPMGSASRMARSIS